MKIEDVMTRKIIYGTSCDSIYGIAKKMKEYDIGFMPIIDDKKIIGIITDRDIVVNNVYNETEHIKDLIHKNIITIDKNKSIEDAAFVMKENKIKRLIVTNGEKIEGIVSLSDIASKLDSKVFLDVFTSIYEINRNDDKFNTDIDEFYL